MDSNVRALRQFASAAVRGGMEIEEIRALGDLVQHDAIGAKLTLMADRAEQRRSAGLGNMAKLLVKVARHYVEAPEAELEELQRITERITPPRQKGISAKNRDRLRQVFADDNLVRLLALPGMLAAKAEALDNPRKAALVLETALAIELLTVTALRIKNLAALDLEHNIVHSRRGAVRLVYAEAEIKNGLAIHKPLPNSAVALLDRFLDGPRDFLLDGASPMPPPR